MREKIISIFMLAMILFGTAGAVYAEASRFIGFGDSNTEGLSFNTYGYDLNKRWVVLTGAINAGVSGNHTDQALKRFNSDVLAKNPDSVAIMFGINDGLLYDNGKPMVDKVKFEKNLTYMVKELKARKVKVLLMTNIPVHQTLYYNMYPEKKHLYADKGGIRLWMNSYNAIIRKVAKAEGVQLVDHYANAIHKAGGAQDGKLWASGLYDHSGLHWSPRGHGMMAYSINYYLAR
ncbi:GDSL-type esterase/lipase family protein [Aeromicrobium ponti]|uniref:Lysophospholipase L1-like esterase n=1 Tax=Cytobacillus oceanisediminis TaxID=665099 RepID=A0A562J572_9BACI|nr:SGNH/GDSL hydrolase family protein [Cytobacillus oceanisediminis]TWH78321.1 lysophospholipase L1-like esterase [Cytobacillus oceanisediminis]